MKNDNYSSKIPDMFAPMTEEEVENFEDEMQPRNFEKPADEVDIHEAVNRVSNNFDNYF
jgi:hypothetical protein